MKASSEKRVFTIDEIADGRHGPVSISIRLKSGTGSITAGQLVAKDTDGEIVPYTTGGTGLVGVALRTVKLDEDESVLVLVHGTARREKLTVGTAAVTQTEIDKLMGIGVYA